MTEEQKKPVDDPKPIKEEDKPAEKTETPEVKPESKEVVEEGVTKKDDVKKTTPLDGNSDGYVSAREAINALDKEVTIDSITEEELLAQEVSAQLKSEADYFVIKVKKSRAMLAMGVFVLVLWLLPLTFFINNKYSLNLFSGGNTPQEVETKVDEPKPAVLIKAKADSAIATSAAELLRQAGYTVSLEDSEVKELGVTVALRQGKADITNNLVALLQEKFQATNSAAVLTDDSQVDAVIFISP